MHPLQCPEAVLETLRAARPFVESGLYLSEHGSKTQADIFKAADTLREIDKILSAAATPTTTPS